MQSFSLIDPAQAILIETFIALVLLVTYGLYRYSMELRYKLWSIGWFIFAISATSSLLSQGIGLVETDFIAISGMLISSVLILDGVNNHKRRGTSLLIFPLSIIFSYISVRFAILYGVSYGLAFTPPGIIVAYSCFCAASKFKVMTVIRNSDYWAVVIGFVIWSISNLLYLPFQMLLLLDLQVIIMSASIIMTGSGLLAHQISKTTSNYRTQYQLSQLLNGIIQHDIRNYTSNIREAIVQANNSESDTTFWLDLASEIIDSMHDFILEIRNISASVTRFEIEKMPLELNTILTEVISRIQREYDLTTDNIEMNISKDLVICNCKIVNELFWNIIDNSFKHGADKVRIDVYSISTDEIQIELSDNAGGMSPEIQTFLNNSESLSNPEAPGAGLGIILIRGLTTLCGISMRVIDLVTDQKVIGSIYRMGLERYIEQI